MQMKRSYFGKLSVLLTVALIVLSAIGITIFASAAETGAQNYTATPITSISSTEDLQKFVDSVNTGGLTYEGQTVVLKNDITWEGTWQSINQFDGTFKGEGHTISGLTDAFITNLGETGKLESLNISSNITFSDQKIEDDSQKIYIGGIADVNYGIISGCTFGGNISGVIDNAGNNNDIDCGGIVGNNKGGIENCSTTKDTKINIDNKSENPYLSISLGGIVGNCSIQTNDKKELQASLFYNCVNNAAIEYNSAANDDHGIDIGGICGNFFVSQLYPIQKCENNGDITTTNCGNTGGIVGILTTSSIYDCKNNGYINTTNCQNTGGITGYAEVYNGYSINENIFFQIDNCTNYGNVTGNVNSGGIIGYSSHFDFNLNSGYITNCINTGNVIGNVNSGGIIAAHTKTPMAFSKDEPTSSLELYITNCINTGDISTNGYGGGISANPFYKIERCYNTGNVYANLKKQDSTDVDDVDDLTAIGGIAAVNANEISYCFNIGDIKIDVEEPLPYTGVAGGLVGIQDNTGKLVCCYNSGPVTGNYNSSTSKTEFTVYYGGLVGQCNTATIENSTFNKDSAGKAERAIGSYFGEDSDFGLEASEITGEAAKENMPYLFQDGVFEIMEDIKIDGVYYSFTPILADMENPYSIDPDKMMSNASYAYVKVIVNQNKNSVENPETGDIAIMGIILLSLISVVVIIFVVKKKKK